VKARVPTGQKWSPCRLFRRATKIVAETLNPSKQQPQPAPNMRRHQTATPWRAGCKRRPAKWLGAAATLHGRPSTEGFLLDRDERKRRRSYLPPGLSGSQSKESVLPSIQPRHPNQPLWTRRRVPICAKMQVSLVLQFCTPLWPSSYGVLPPTTRCRLRAGDMLQYFVLAHSP
jgi:hypothetical protein